MAARSPLPAPPSGWFIRESPQHRILVIAAQTGDLEAFTALYNVYAGPVKRLCLQMLGNQAAAEDLSQEIFLKLWRKIETFRGDSRFTTWLYRLAVNQILMEFRKKRPPESLDALMLPDEQGIHYEPSEEDPVLLATFQRTILREVVGTLSDNERRLFDLYFVQGYTHHEITEAFSCTLATSKSRVHKLRVKLVRHLRTLRDQVEIGPPSLPC